MIKIEYHQTNYEELLRHIAKTLKLKAVDHTIHLSPEVGEGTIRLFILENGIQVLVYNFTPSTTILLQRKKINKDFYTLRLDDIAGTEVPSQSKASVFFGSTHFDQLYLANAGYHIKSINIIFSKEWLDAFLSYDTSGDNITKFISLKMGSFIYEPMDSEYRRLMKETLELGDDKRFEKMIVQNRAMVMIERFFTRVYKKSSDALFDVKLSNSDISRLKLVEAELLKDFSAEPPLIVNLARIAAMSPSKLKESFKKMFGVPVYQYYQRNRMNKAKAMLLSRKYTVREVGDEVGFSSVSNFAKAFKKTFDQLPGDLLGN